MRTWRTGDHSRVWSCLGWDRRSPMIHQCLANIFSLKMCSANLLLTLEEERQAAKQDIFVEGLVLDCEDKELEEHR